jgi:hypothetical protein
MLILLSATISISPPFRQSLYTQKEEKKKDKPTGGKFTPLPSRPQTASTTLSLASTRPSTSSTVGPGCTTSNTTDNATNPPTSSLKPSRMRSLSLFSARSTITTMLATDL